MIKSISILTITLILSACATVSETNRDLTSQSFTEESVTFDHYSGEKTRIAVFPLAMSEKTMKDFPEYTKKLKQKSVGFALWHKITDALYETKRFTLLEISEEIVKSIIEQTFLGQTGMTDPSATLKMGGFKQAENFIYGEIISFSVDTQGTVKAFSKNSGNNIYNVGIQLRYVNGETLEFIPATSQGKALSIEKATEIAIRKAIKKLTKRI